MKQTLTVNLNGIVFHIDNDAYEMLQDYLQKVESNLNSEDVADVLQDIEARIGELFTEMLRKQGVQVVNVAMTEQVMQQLGDPEMFADDEESGVKSQESGQKRPIKKRLYRDVDNDLLGGVCAGLGAYFGIDAIWFRLLLVFFMVVYGAGFFLYLLLWIIVPAARTAAQRLEMRGIEPSVGNIEQEVRRTKDEEPSNKGCLRSGVSLLLKGFVGICLLFTMPVLLFVVFILGVVLVTLIAALFGTVPVFITSALPFQAMASNGEIYCIALFLLFTLSIILIPIIMLVHWLVTHFRKREVVSKRFWWITGILWLVSLFGLGGVTIYASTHDSKGLSLLADDDWDDADDYDYALVTNFGELDAFHSIVVAGHADIELTQGESQWVSMQTVRPELYTVEVRDSVLYISCKESQKPIDVDFTIVIPTLRSIVCSGACSIENTGVLDVSDLYLQASGAAAIDMHVHAQHLTLQSSGASKSEFEGVADHFHAIISGAGEIEAYDLRARTANVVCSGAGKVEVSVSDTLSAQASGASKIEYRGTPVLAKSITGGMSKIRQDN